MRVLTKPGRRQRQSLAGPTALVLAAVCLVQLHLLLRPGSRWAHARPHSMHGPVAGVCNAVKCANGRMCCWPCTGSQPCAPRARMPALQAHLC